MKYENGNVFINETQYFEGVPEVAWNFYIGGYQPAQKWLKDRKDRELQIDDIRHYLKIIVALFETDRLMKEIDSVANPWCWKRRILNPINPNTCGEFTEVKSNKMEYNSEELKSFKTPTANMKSKYLKIDMIRISVLRKIISKTKHIEVLNRTITENRVIING